MYEKPRELHAALEAWVAGGLVLDESVVVIATPENREQLEQRLRARGLNVTTLQLEDRLFLLDAQDTLGKFMRNGLPDPVLFEELIARLIARAANSGRSVRAFGEMVVLLFQSGNRVATMVLETLWSEVCSRTGLALLCAYPHGAFDEKSQDYIRHVCDAHSTVVLS